MSSKLQHGAKTGSWSIPEFDFEAFANGGGQVFDKFYPDNV